MRCHFCPWRERSLHFLVWALGISLLSHAWGGVFQLPTANHGILEPGKEESFFVGTAGKPWTSGTFGCVRSDGWQMHEGLDIRCLQRDRKGEPMDPVMAAADGTVAYVNTRPSLSNYGNYVILRHQIEGLDVYTLYAHLSSVRAGLKFGVPVKAGEQVGVMGRTSNTRQRITPDRAHVHFEINLLMNGAYSAWHKAHQPGERNDHGDWNGKNLVGIDPRLVLLAQQKEGEKFSLLNFVRNQNELCRVMVRDTRFGWLQRYAVLVRPNPRAEKEGVAGYEISFNFNGVAFALTPRAASEIKSKMKVQLVSVNDAEQQKNPCRRLVTKKAGRWELTSHGMELISLLTY
jgi:murein DD-endopeptidase MepM/ murein hydrolase activator NlpD